MYHAVKELLFHPDIFFTQKAGEKIDLIYPGIIVVIGGVVGLMTPFIVSAFSRGEKVNVIMMPDAVIVGLLLPFIAWILISGMLFVLCRLFSGTGTFGATIQNAGYGALPLTILSAVGIFNGILIGRFMEIPKMIGTVAIVGLGLLSVLFVIWSGCLWTYAMEKTHAIPHGKAMAAASVVVLLYMSLMLINILATVYLTLFSAR